jgi:hypothetical protein
MIFKKSMSLLGRARALFLSSQVKAVGALARPRCPSNYYPCIYSFLSLISISKLSSWGVVALGRARALGHSSHFNILGNNERKTCHE